MTKKLKCAKCGHETDLPRHCNEPMHIEAVNGQPKLVCWMGPGCGVAGIPIHCGLAMRESG